MFRFQGALEISKSWMNRALVLQSYAPEMKIVGSSQSQDVLLLKAALADLAQAETELYAGLGGTTFRFLALRASREKGNFYIKADAKLLARPQTELIHILQQLGVQAFFDEGGLRITSSGWVEPKGSLIVSTRESSQFLSAVLLNSLKLPFDLLVQMEDEFISAEYFRYTLKVLSDAGVQAIQFENSIFIKKESKPVVESLHGELDVSSAFSLVAAGLVNGDVEITNWNADTTQPDIQFLDFFKLMGIQFLQSGHSFKIQKQNQYQGLSASLAQCPDLFPVLSVICALAQGESHLFGAPQLKFKESDRIAKTCELLKKAGVRCESLEDGIKIKGGLNQKEPFSFDPAHDHRMAMAATLLKLAGCSIELLHPEVIRKSYPQFYQHVGLDL